MTSVGDMNNDDSEKGKIGIKNPRIQNILLQKVEVFMEATSKWASDLARVFWIDQQKLWIHVTIDQTLT